MGEYATHNGQQIKIGTCEQMYYLRADQVNRVEPLAGSVNPRNVKQAGSIRFRFPFPQEDGIAPGQFSDHDFGLGLYDIEPPQDIDHHSLQFTRNYPQSGGLLLSLPCPRSRLGKIGRDAADKLGIKISYNGYSGPVHIHSQRLVDRELKLIMRCGDCGALWRVDTLEEAAPVLAILEKKGDDYHREIAKRIVDGYTKPNFWYPASELVAA